MSLVKIVKQNWQLFEDVFSQVGRFPKNWSADEKKSYLKQQIEDILKTFQKSSKEQNTQFEQFIVNFEQWLGTVQFPLPQNKAKQQTPPQQQDGYHHPVQHPYQQKNLQNHKIDQNKKTQAHYSQDMKVQHNAHQEKNYRRLGNQQHTEPALYQIPNPPAKYSNPSPNNFRQEHQVKGNKNYSKGFPTHVEKHKHVRPLNNPPSSLQSEEAQSKRILAKISDAFDQPERRAFIFEQLKKEFQRNQ